MPNNYSITTFNFTEEILDAMYAGNMLEGGTMTITPDPGFVVSASDFSHGTPLPEAVATCVFTDTGTAGYPGNTVLVTFTFQNLFTITSSLPPIYIHIIGDATIFREDDRTISFNIDFIDNTIKNVNGRTVIANGINITETPPNEEDALDSATGLQTTALSGTIPSGEQYIIATISTIADGNYHFDNPPTIRTENIPEGVVSFIFASVATRNSNDEVTFWYHRLMLGANSNLSNPDNGSFCIMLDASTSVISPVKNVLSKLSYILNSVTRFLTFNLLGVPPSPFAYDINTTSESSKAPGLSFFIAISLSLIY